MGIDVDEVTFLCLAKRLGVDFSSTVTLGRQSLFASAVAIRESFGSFELAFDEKAVERNRPFADGLLACLGATSTVESIDHSDFEGASFQYDLNLPLPDDMCGKHSLVLDGGTTEHVFNLTVALESSMRLVAPDGHLMIVVPANQSLGHGFYQVGPELYLRALVPANGFSIEIMLLKESGLRERWFQPVDPKQLGRRLEFTTVGPTTLYVLARRVGTPVMSVCPQQSDYEDAWAEQRSPSVSEVSSAAWRRGRLAAVLPLRATRMLRGFRSTWRAWLGADLERVDPVALATFRQRDLDTVDDFPRGGS